MVKALAAQGWQVTATYRSSAPEVAAQWHALDMTHQDEVWQLATALQGDSFDAILINAGIAGPSQQNLLQSSDAELAQLCLTNAISPVRCAETLLPLLAKQNGVIDFTTLILGSLNENDAATMPIYSASKSALNMLSRALLPQVEAHNGTLLSLHPGWVKTDMGGESAPVTVEQSGEGLVQRLVAYRKRGGHHYVDYAGQLLQW
ncbi:C-factor|nr:C-factor [Candidatus Pantoea persica]